MNAHHHRITHGMIATGILIPVLVTVLTPLSGFQIRFFCEPAARLSSAFLSAPVQSIESGFLLGLAFPIEVTLACSGIKFFALMLAVITGLAVERGWSWRGYATLVPMAYAATLLANTSRIVCTWYIDSLCAPIIGEKFKSGLHGVLGALIFMSFLTALYTTLWRTSYEHRSKTTAA